MALRAAAASAAVLAALAVPAPAAAQINQCSTAPAEAQVSHAEPEETRLYDPRRLHPVREAAPGYSLADFGLNRAEVDQRFGEYRAEFDV